MFNMTATSQIKVDFDWIGQIPSDIMPSGEKRKPGESNGHHLFFNNCMNCDRFASNHQLKCDDEKELALLFARYAERLTDVLPFKMYPEDFEAIAKGTWGDPEYQKARQTKPNER